MSKGINISLQIVNNLGGGFQYFLFSPVLGEMIQFDEHIFQTGWTTCLHSIGPFYLQTKGTVCCFANLCCNAGFHFRPRAFLDSRRRWQDAKDKTVRWPSLMGVELKSSVRSPKINMPPHVRWLFRRIYMLELFRWANIQTFIILYRRPCQSNMSEALTESPPESWPGLLA